MQDSSTHARQSTVCQKSPPTTVPANASLSPMKKRGPRHPQKYPNPNERAATGNIQQNIQASVNASVIEAEDFELVQAGIWYCSTHYKLDISPE